MPREDSCPSFKLVVLGCHSVGKTSVVKAYCHGQFSEDVLTTIGAGYFCHTEHYQETAVSVILWDTAGQERFHSVAPQFYHGSDGLVLVYDRTKVETFQGLSEYKENFLKNTKIDSQTPFPILLLGNKSDLGDCTVPDEMVSEWAAQNGTIRSHYVSAKTGEGIAAAFLDIVEALVRRPRPQRSEKRLIAVVTSSTSSDCC
jgi:small GTP-binding protein